MCKKDGGWEQERKSYTKKYIYPIGWKEKGIYNVKRQRKEEG